MSTLDTSRTPSWLEDVKVLSRGQSALVTVRKKNGQRLGYVHSTSMSSTPVASRPSKGKRAFKSK